MAIGKDSGTSVRRRTFGLLPSGPSRRASARPYCPSESAGSVPLKWPALSAMEEKMDHFATSNKREVGDSDNGDASILPYARKIVDPK